MANVDPRTEDMWLLGRNKTASYRGELPERAIRWVIQSLPGVRTKMVPMSIMTFGTPASGLGVDLNSHRADVNVEMLYDMGVRIFDLRMFCPGRWEYNNWQYFMDTTFMPYYTRLRKLPDAIIGGYGVLNLWLDEEAGYNSPLDENVRLMKLYSKNAPCDYYCWDNEVGQIYKNGNPNTIITGVNLVKCMANVFAQTLREMEHWPSTNYPKIPEHYSAMWFLKQFGGESLAVWLDGVLNPANAQNLPFLPWLAWIPTVFSESFATPRDLFDKVITPNGIQENAYLHRRSEILATKWQCSWTLKGPWSPTVGIDCSITYGLGASLSQYKYLHNIPTEVTPPPPPPPGDYATKAELEAHKADKTAHTHTHITGSPVN